MSCTSPRLSEIPLIPTTSTRVARIILLALEKSTFCSTKIRKPDAAITPNNRSDTPPITGPGILAITEEKVPEKESRIAITAAPPITNTEYTLVKAMTPIFSP
ncbi:hypothetical protein D3C87_1815990 [compost metagenome]